MSEAPGTVAWREYEYHLPDGTEAAFAASLCELIGDNPGAELARQQGALAHGLIAVAGMHDAAPRPLVWFQTKDELVLLVSRDDQPISDDLCKTIVRVLTIFFRDVRLAVHGLTI